MHRKLSPPALAATAIAVAALVAWIPEPAQSEEDGQCGTMYTYTVSGLPGQRHAGDKSGFWPWHEDITVLHQSTQDRAHAEEVEYPGAWVDHHWPIIGTEVHSDSCL